MPKPNIIFILADDLGYGDFGCYGQRKIKTPHIDRLAGAGVRFTNHYAGNACCAPSRCSLMTGLHSGHAPIRWNKSVEPVGVLPLPRSTPTVAEVMREAGYATGMTGRWHLGGTKSDSQPFQRGFDYYFGALNEGMVPNVAGYYFRRYIFEGTAADGRRTVQLEGNADDGRKTYDQDLLTEKAEQFIRSNSANPFFLYMPYTIAHEPLMVPEFGEYANEDWGEGEKIYAAMITRLDSYVGQVVRLVKDLGIERNTLILFSSDNGADGVRQGRDPDFFQSNGPLRGYKFDSYEGAIRIPLIAAWPGMIQPGRVSDHPCAFWDFMPTACEVAGARPPGQCDGISYLPELLNAKQPAHDQLYWENHGRRKSQVVRQGDWKLIDYLAEGRVELFHLAEDLGETRNLAESQPALVRRLTSIAAAARTVDPNFPLPERPL